MAIINKKAGFRGYTIDNGSLGDPARAPKTYSCDELDKKVITYSNMNSVDCDESQLTIGGDYAWSNEDDHEDLKIHVDTGIIEFPARAKIGEISFSVEVPVDSVVEWSVRCITSTKTYSMGGTRETSLDNVFDALACRFVFDETASWARFELEFVVLGETIDDSVESAHVSLRFNSIHAEFANELGYTKRCMFALKFQHHLNDVSVSITSGTDDWGAQMGDGSIIPLSNPVIIYQSKDNAVVQFDMLNAYPSNSPCILVYRSDSAQITVDLTDSSAPFTINSVSGNFAFTIDYNNNSDNWGYVNTLLATIDYPNQRCDVDFEISTDPTHWGARMGDGAIIALSNPVIVAVNPGNAVVRFSMDRRYPANSPCILVYRSEDAWFTAIPVNRPNEFVSVMEINNVPASITSGTSVDLSVAEVYPYDATELDIIWTVVSGPASINGDILSATGPGDIEILATIKNGVGDGEDFTETFVVVSGKNVITITAQPYENCSHGDNLYITAESTIGLLTYQWYSNLTKSISGATEIVGATTDKFTVPSAEHSMYYFCRISSPGATSVNSKISSALIAVKLKSISIIPETQLYTIDGSVHAHQVIYDPSEYKGDIRWTSSNPDVASIDADGVLTLIMNGSATITATETITGISASKNITVTKYVPVTNITNVTESIETDTDITLSGTVVPSNASSKSITWSIVDAGSTDATIDGDTLRCNNDGTIVVKATVVRGIAYNQDFSKDFVIRVIKKTVFIPVTDIILDGIDLDSEYETGTVINISATVVPPNATHKDVQLEAGDDGLSNVTAGSIMIAGSGDVTKLIATIVNGSGTADNMTTFRKEFIIKTKERFEFIPVTNCYIDFTNEDGTSNGIYLPTYGEVVEIPITVIPDDSTHGIDDIVISLLSIEHGKAEGYSITVENVQEWSTYTGDGIEISPNRTVCATKSKLEYDHVYRINLRVVVKNGLSEGTDYSQDVQFAIVGKTGDIFVPVEDISIAMPSRLRAYYPILINRYSPTPSMPSVVNRDDMSIAGITFNTYSKSEDTAVNSAILHPANDNLYLTLDPLPIFMWGFFERYLYPWNPGKLTLRISIPDATVADLNDFDVYEPDKIEFVKEIDLTIEDPFIQVKSIENIPSTVPMGNTGVVLSPHINTGKGLDCYNPYWDEEEATYQDVKWSVISGSATITDGVLVATSSNIRIRATIENGVDEDFIWYPYKPNDDTVDAYKAATKDSYGRAYNATTGEYSNPVYVQDAEPAWSPENVSVPYIQEFDIVGKPFEDFYTSSGNILTMTMMDGSKIIIDSFSDLCNLCNDKPDNAIIPLSGNRSFTKNQVREIEFAKSHQEISTIQVYTVIDATTTTIGIDKISTKGSLSGIIEAPNVVSIADDHIETSAYYDAANSTNITLVKQDPQNMVRYKGSSNSGNAAVRLVANNVFGNGLNASIVVKLNRSIRSTSGNSSFDNVVLGINACPYNDTVVISKNKSGNYDTKVFDVSLLFDRFSSSFTESTILQSGAVSVTSESVSASFNSSTKQLAISVVNGAPKTTATVSISIPKAATPTGCTLTTFYTSGNNPIAVMDYIGYYNNINTRGIVGGNQATEVASGMLFKVNFTSNMSSDMYLEDIGNGIMIPWSLNNGVSQSIRLFLSNVSDIVSNTGLMQNAVKEIQYTMAGNMISLNGFDTKGSPLTWDDFKNYPYILISFLNPARDHYKHFPGYGWACDNNRITRNIQVIVDPDGEYGEIPESTSLRNFGRNFTNLTSVKNIPMVTGESCMESFLRGCTSFNQAIIVPPYVTGRRAMKDFLRDCTSFNKVVTLPNNISGESVLHGFLRGCTSFNQAITLPSRITGSQCLRSFLQGCIAFNKAITIPSGVSGWGCLYEFMSECESFNQPITLPTNVRDSSDPGREMVNFMRGCDSMTSDINIPTNTGKNAEVSEQTLSSKHLQSDLSQIGVQITGAGAEDFLTKVQNKYDIEEWPYTHFKNLD